MTGDDPTLRPTPADRPPAPVLGATGHRTGVVADFDDHAGHGTVRDSTGAGWFFHCTEIADGTRTVKQGTPVVFTARAGHRGRWEAAALVKVDDPEPGKAQAP